MSTGSASIGTSNPLSNDKIDTRYCENICICLCVFSSAGSLCMRWRRWPWLWRCYRLVVIRWERMISSVQLWAWNWELGTSDVALIPRTTCAYIGVVTYELSTGRRPFEIHSQTPTKEIRLLFLRNPEWPATWPPEFVYLVSKVRMRRNAWRDVRLWT